MSRLPKTGIVTRTKNRPVLLKRAIESVLFQSYRNWVMVIVNDGGEPSDVDRLVESYSSEAAGRIRVVHNVRSMGMEVASKIGLDSIDSDLLIVHDDDDSWAPEFLAVTIPELIRQQEKFPSVQGVTTYCNRVMEQVRGNLIQIDSVELFNGWVPSGFLSLDRMLAGNFLPPISFLFTRQAYAALGGIYERIPYLGDWDFLIRFLSKFDVVMIPQYLAFYHWRAPTVAGSLGNTVTDELDQHVFYRQLLLNQWLRDDLAAQSFGIGVYANLRHQLDVILHESRNRASPVPAPGLAVGTPLPEGPETAILPQTLVDYYWDSRSYRYTRSFRNLWNRLRGRRAEERPRVANFREAWGVARALQGSVSWTVTAPLRWFGRLFRRTH